MKCQPTPVHASRGVSVSELINHKICKNCLFWKSFFVTEPLTSIRSICMAARTVGAKEHLLTHPEFCV